MKAVIYKIKNIVDGKFYIGSAKNFKNRKLRHINDLRNNTHNNIYLQRAYDKYGESSFVFEIIEEIDENLDQYVIEQKYLDELDFSKVYNIGKTAKGGDNISNHPNKEEFINRMVNSIKKLRAEGKIKPPDTKGDKNPNWRGGGKKCECGKKIQNNYATCADCRDRTQEKNPFYGKVHTDETKDKISKANKGKVNECQLKPFFIDGVEYKSLSEAEKLTGIHYTTIRHRIISPNPKFVNYKYKE